MADATVDLVTLAEIKPGLNITATDTTYDTELATVITAVSQRFRDVCGAIINTTYTDEANDGGASDIVLRRASAVSDTVTTTIGAVKEYDTSGALTTLTAETVTIKPDTGYLLSNEIGERNRLIRRSAAGDAYFAWGRANILVTYTTGRAANTAAVAANFKQAAIITINHIWSSLGAQSGAARPGQVDGLAYGIPSFSIPKAALDLIRDEVNPPGIG
jgi:hypothetical protein